MNKKIFLLSSIVFFAMVLNLGYYHFTKPRLGFVSIGKLYSEFDLKKDLEGKYSKIEQTRKLILDSLEIQLRGISRRLESGKNVKETEKQFFQEKIELYKTKKKSFTEDNQALSNQYSEQIQKQLNQYLKDFGTEKHYDFIFGANSEGSLMYSKDVYDISDEVLKYINLQYRGLKNKND